MNLARCTVVGDAAGSCGTPIVTVGDEPERAELRFRIDVGAPPSAPNLNLTCTHGPVWPQGGEPVTVTLDALDGGLAPKLGRSSPWRFWLNDRAAPARVALGAATSNATIPAPAAGATLFYGCRVFDDGEEVWSGWRVVQVGMPATGRAVPVVNTGPQASRLDIVFVPDRFWYTGADDPQFLADVSVVIDAYYGEWAFLRRQDHFNFWLAADLGTVRDDCDSEPPANWDTAYTFADAGALTHRFPPEVGADDDSPFTVRDCAPGGERFFSGRAANPRVFLHETGHRPFGLADGSCCDGGYFMAEPLPNLYGPTLPGFADLAGRVCELDAPTLIPFDRLLGFPDPRSGRLPTARSTEDGPAFTSDAAGNHLMDDNRRVRGADLRQMEFVFSRCRQAGC